MTLENEIVATAVPKDRIDIFLASKIAHNSEAVKMAAKLFFEQENQIAILEYFDLSNGGFFFKPANFKTSIVSEEMFGIILTDLALSRVYEHTQDLMILNLIEKLNDFHAQKVIEEEQTDSMHEHHTMH